MPKSKENDKSIIEFLNSVTYWQALCPDKPIVQQMINNTHRLLYYIFNGYPKNCEYRIKNDMVMAVKYLSIEAELVPMDCFKQISFGLIEQVKAKYFERYGTEVAA